MRYHGALRYFSETETPPTVIVAVWICEDPTDDHEIRQLVLRHGRHGGPRLYREADQRPPLFERGAGPRAAQGGGLRPMHGHARLQHVLDGRAPFSARRHRVDPEPLDDGDAPLRRHQEPEDRL